MKSFLIPFLSALAAFGWGGFSSAQAATGAAPPSQQRRIVSGVHTDAIFASHENGRLLLGSKADLDGNLGVRLDPNLTAFNVEQSRKTKIPNAPSFAFLGTPGSDVWIAPEPNPGPGALWPGFSTEGVPTGVLDGNQLTFRLDAVSGPGTVHIFQNSAFGEPVRLLTGTGTDFRTWTVPRGTHAHANWAFSAPGHYLLTFTATAMTNGVSISATQNYAFVVGDVPPATVSTTTLAVNTNATMLGSPISLSATVSPANAVGSVEFLDGATILGHDAVNAGSASLTTANLALGARSVTARFVPQWLNDFSASTSAPVVITVGEPSGVPFAVTGIAASYQPGGTLTATLSGYTLAPGEQVRWLIRRVGTTFGGSNLRTAESLTYTNILDISWDGFEMAAQVRQGSTAIATTGWVPISVAPMPGVAPISTQFPAGIQYAGDVLVFPLSRALAAGETARLAWLTEVGTRWQAAPTILVGDTLQTRAIWTQINFTQIEFAIQIIRDGVAVAQSARVAGSVIDRQVQVAGLQGVYRPGQILNATAQVIPPMEGLAYRWTVLTNTSSETIVKEGTAPEALTLSLPTTLDMNGKLIKFYAFADDLVGTNRVMVSYWFTRLAVSDTADQIFAFSPLSDHYHQGYPINLVLGADPSPASNDTIVWEWRWPGTDWTQFPGAEGLSKSLVAEQALNGLEVRATLQFGDTTATKLAGPVTILVDDHGFPANQKPTITGLTNLVVGNLATLTRQLPANGATILTTHRWEQKAAGASEFSVISGATNATLNFTTTLADDGAQYRVSILKPDGTVAYGPSPAVTLDVTPAISSDFSITGVAASYQPGDILQARIAGVTLVEGQGIQWRVRPVGTDFTGTVLGQFVLPETNNPESRAGRLDLRLDASFDNYELQAAIIQADQTLGTTGWVPVRVSDAVQPLSLTYVGPQPFRIGDTATLAAQGRALATGESLRVVLYPGLPHYSLWFVPPSGYSTIAPGTFQFEPSGQTLLPMALQVVRDGLVIAQSESLVVDAARVEFFFEGMQPVYRVGQTFSASIRTAPDLGDKVTYSWAMYDTYDHPIKVAKGEAGRTFEMPVTAEMNGKRMFIQANVIYPSGNVGLVGGAYPFLTVTTNTAQLFLFSSLNEHYHQGDSVNLTLTADPGLTAADSVVWEWRWPGMSWETLPQAAGLSHQLTAEQAMDGLEVRATLNFGHTNVTPLAGPVTILVDDHGILALQQPKITGPTNVAAGNLVTLTRQLPTNAPTILTKHRWERKAAGASEFSVIPGATTSTLDFPATIADDRAQYRVSILKPNGDLAYGPSPVATLEVEPATPIGSITLVPFARPTQHGGTIGTEAGLVVSADFNGDGKVDVVTAGYGSGSLSLFQGIGDGSFLAERGLNVGSDYRSWTLAAVDFDTDGKVDLVATEVSGTTGEIVFYKNDGTGNFMRLVLAAALPPISRSRVGDLNGDGRPDIVYFKNDTTLVFQTGNASNGLDPESVVSSAFSSAATLALADVNADGRLDIVAADTAANRIRVLNQSSSGTFELSSEVVVASGVDLKQVVDLNGDGLPDLLTTDTDSQSPNKAGYYAQLTGGQFGPRVNLPIYGQAVNSLRAADFNRDGVIDIAFGNLFYDEVAFSFFNFDVGWLLGQGSGAFGPSVFLKTYGSITGELIAPDLDGDLDPDIVIGGAESALDSETLYAFVNQTGENPMRLIPPPALTRTASDPIDLQVYFGFPITVTGTPRIALQVGANIVYANYIGGNGTPSLQFRYNVTATDVDLDGAQLASNVIGLNGGTMKNPLDGDAVLEFPDVVFTGVMVNGAGPLVQGITRLDPALTVASTVRFEVAFAEPVTGVDEADFEAAMKEGALAGATVQSVSGSGSTYQVTVATGRGSGTLGLNVKGSASIFDLNGDVLGKGFKGGQVYTVRRAALGDIDTFYTHGHGDYRPTLINGEISWILRPDAGLIPGSPFPSDAVITYLDSTSIVTRPEAAAYDFLGVPADAPLYLSGSSGSLQATVPYLGFSGESIPPGTFAAYNPGDPRLSSTPLDYIKVELVGMRSSSSGDFSLYSVLFNGNVRVWMASSDGITSSDNIWLRSASHSHYNLAFTEPGTYELDVLVKGFTDDNRNGTYEPLSDQYVESGIKRMVFHLDTLGARADAFTVVEGSTLSGNVSLNDDWHEAMGTYMASVQTGPANGTLTLTTNGSFTYVPNAGFSGTDGFAYRVTNDRGGFTTATASIEVAALPKDLTLSLANGSATLSVTTQNGLIYQLQSAPTVTGPWTDVGDPISGTGQIVPVVVPVSGPTGFFQWRIVGNP